MKTMPRFLLLAFLLLPSVAFAQKQVVDIGSTVNDGTGDPLRTAFDKINDNFGELYNADILISASDSPAAWTNKSKYQCTGTADNAVFQTAVTALGSAGGTIAIAPGSYSFAAAQTVTVTSGIRITGAGSGTHITLDSSNSNANNQGFRVIGTNIDSSPVERVVIENMRIDRPGQAGAVYLYRAKGCIVRNLWGSGPDGDDTAGHESFVSMRESMNCKISDIWTDGSGAADAANWVSVFGQQCFGCTYERIYAKKTRTALDFWGNRDCMIRGVWAYECNEALDLGNTSQCSFEGLHLFDSEENAITLKEESGSTSSTPSEYASDYVYGSQYNTFSGLRIKNYTTYGIGFSTDSGSSNAQPMDHNTIQDFVIENDTDPTNASNHAAIRLNPSGVAGQNAWNTGVKIRGGRIVVTKGSGIEHTSLHNAVIDNVYIDVQAGFYTMENLEAGSMSTHSGQDNTLSNCHFKKSDTTNSTSNINLLTNHEVGLRVSGCTIEGGWIGHDLTNTVRSQIVNTVYRGTQGYGLRCRPVASVDRTSQTDSVDLVLNNVMLIDTNLVNTSRGAIFFEVNGNIANANDIRMIGVGIIDTQGTATGQAVQWNILNAGTFSNVKRIGNWIYSGATPSLPVGGSGNAVSG